MDGGPSHGPWGQGMHGAAEHACGTACVGNPEQALPHLETLQLLFKSLLCLSRALARGAELQAGRRAGMHTQPIHSDTSSRPQVSVSAHLSFGQELL